MPAGRESGLGNRSRLLSGKEGELKRRRMGEGAPPLLEYVPSIPIRDLHPHRRAEDNRRKKKAQVQGLKKRDGKGRVQPREREKSEKKKRRLGGSGIK